VNAARADVVTPVAAVVAGIPKEDAGDGPWTELVRSCRCRVRVAKTPEDAEVVVARWSTQEELMRRRRLAGAARASIEQERSGLERLGPKRQRSGAVDEHRAHGVVQCPENTLCLAILLGGVWA
jgi:hypothetical protein